MVQVGIGTSSGVLCSFRGGDPRKIVVRFNGNCFVAFDEGASSASIFFRVGEVMVLNPKEYVDGLHTVFAYSVVSTTAQVDRGSFDVVPVVSSPGDRNPVIVDLNYQGSVGPHANVQRWVYTVPVGKKAVMTSGLVHVVRVSVAAPVGKVVANITTATFAVSKVQIETNVIGDRDRSQVSAGLILVAGDVLSGNTSDAGTGGSLDYHVSSRVLEYDL